MKDMETRVWQRVRGNPEASSEQEWHQMIHNARQMEAVYTHLIKSATGQNRELLRKLQEGEQANIACLKGMGALMGKKVRQNTLPPPTDPAPKALEACFHLSRRAAIGYMAQSAGGEFGEVFRFMADRAGMQCVLIAQLLGQLGDGKLS